MQVCPSCGYQNPDTAGFCSQCGTKLAAKAVPRSATMFLQAEQLAQRHRLVVVRSGGVDGVSLVLPIGKAVMGRGEVQLRMDDAHMSPRHAEFTLRDDRLTVNDLQSSNGVFIRLHGETKLTAGDELRLGRQLLRFEALPAPEFTADSGRVWGSPNRSARFRVAQLLEGSGLGEALPIGEGEYLFGREEGGMTFPADPSVSRRHAVMTVSRTGVVVRDLESANGTFLRLREEMLLAPGDQLLIGMQQLRYDLG